MKLLKLLYRKLKNGRVRILLRAENGRRLEMSSSVSFAGKPILTTVPESRIRLGPRARLVSTSRSTDLGVNHPVVLRTLVSGARILIGRDVGISGGSICAASLVQIGDGVLIGANVTIADTDFHPVDSSARRYAPLPPPREGDAVVIGDNVFIGTAAVILKGSRIGSNSVVGAGAIVKGHFASGSVIAGNPARSIKSLALEDES
ncbi:DapH/DapD/GlmU-related protein [Curtobacterium pusillum]|uniref:acyltransferase n=1 Tax=Curtobacterium pusillum TaxID=69373 RepID=UPI0011A482B1|nr:acyltransferase [Curtobacterium pusillum]